MYVGRTKHISTERSGHPWTISLYSRLRWYRYSKGSFSLELDLTYMCTLMIFLCPIDCNGRSPVDAYISHLSHEHHCLIPRFFILVITNNTPEIVRGLFTD